MPTHMNIQHEETGRIQEWSSEHPIPHGWARVSELFPLNDAPDDLRMDTEDVKRIPPEAFYKKLSVIRVELDEANKFISTHHRHHKPVVGHRFSIGVEHNGMLVGCVIVGRPVARQSNQKHIAEVTRLVTDGTRNACSFLYAQAARAAKELGFKSIQTFILPTESGISLKASGWTCTGETKTGSWHTRNNRRSDQPECRKIKWVKVIN